MRKTKRKFAKHLAQAEAAILERIERTAVQAEIGRVGLRVGIGDDAALWRPKRGYETTLTCDRFLEGTHFVRTSIRPMPWGGNACAGRERCRGDGRRTALLLVESGPAFHPHRFLAGSILRGLGRAARRFDCVLAAATRPGSETSSSM